MAGFFHKHQQTILIVVTIATIITFVAYWNGTQAGRLEGRSGGDTFGKIYGRRVGTQEVEREARKFYVSLHLGLADLAQELASAGQQPGIASFVLNLFVLRHEAKALQIVPTDQEVQDAITGLSAFQTGGQFDRAKLDAFIQQALAPYGFSEVVIDDLVRDDLRLKKVREIIDSSVELSPAEFQSLYTMEHEKMQIGVVRFNNNDVLASIPISDEEAQKTFELRKAAFQSEEKRKIKFVTFELNDAEKKLTGKERNDALQKLADHANDFTQAMLEKGANFDEVAKKFQVPVTVTNDFSRATPDPLLAKLPAVSAAAFELTQQDPNSDVIQGENGFYILHLENVTPGKPMTFEEAKPKLVEQMKRERAAEVVSTKAADARNKISDALKAGKSFADAAAAAGVKAETLQPFSLADSTNIDVPDKQTILEKAVDLNEKQLSDFAQTDAGGLLVYMEKREPVDPAAMEKDKATLYPAFERQKRENAFREWLRICREAAKIEVAQQQQAR